MEIVQNLAPADLLTVAVATLALILSIYSTYKSITGKAADDRRQVKSHINSVVLQIIEAQAQYNKEFMVAQRDGSWDQLQHAGSAYSQKILTLGRLGVYLDDQIKSSAADVEYAAIASALASGYDPQADRLWRLAVEASPNEYSLIFNKRGYADYLFSTGRQKDGKDVYRGCLDILKADTDTVKFTDGFTHQTWGISEKRFGSQAEAEEQFRKAESKYREIGSKHTRDWAIYLLNNVRNAPQTMPLPAGTAGASALADGQGVPIKT